MLHRNKSLRALGRGPSSHSRLSLSTRPHCPQRLGSAGLILLALPQLQCGARWPSAGLRQSNDQDLPARSHDGRLCGANWCSRLGQRAAPHQPLFHSGVERQLQDLGDGRGPDLASEFQSGGGGQLASPRPRPAGLLCNQAFGCAVPLDAGRRLLSGGHLCGA